MMNETAHLGTLQLAKIIFRLKKIQLAVQSIMQTLSNRLSRRFPEMPTPKQCMRRSASRQT
jgi:phage terminase Nu1 subunit (DNA packaging protein)